MSVDASDIDSDFVKKLAAEMEHLEVAKLNDKSPEGAVDWYLYESPPTDIKESTVGDHADRLPYFLEYCEANGIDNINYLDKDFVGDYMEFVENHPKDVARSTYKAIICTTRKFLRRCARKGWVRDDLPPRIPTPTLERDDEVRSDIIPNEQAEAALEVMRKYHYASLQHVVWELLSRTSLRTCGARALDLDDYQQDEETGDWYLDVVDRPETETSLKKGEESEREILVDDFLKEVLDDYVADTRHNVADDHGREPLLATQYGRISSSTVRKYVYMWTRPCTYGDCPEGEDPEECEFAQTNDKAYKCPESVAAHAHRRGSVTFMVESGVSEETLSDRVDASPEVIRKWYSQASKSAKRQSRTPQIKSVFDG